MSIISVELKNYKKHKDLKIDMNGKSIILLGDSGLGKSTILELIPSMLGLKEFDTDALTEGEKSGMARIVFDVGGKKYTVTRSYTENDSGRFKVVDDSGRSDSLSKVLSSVFGSAFSNKYFDYHKYFFQLKSSDARVKYFTDAIGDEAVLKNNSKIVKLKAERASLSSDIKAHDSIVKAQGFDKIEEEELESKAVYYQNPRELSEAKEAKTAFLNINTVRIDQLENEREVVAERVEKINIIDDELAKNKAEIKRLQDANKMLVKQKADIDPNFVTRLSELDAEIEAGKEKNAKALIEADDLYLDEASKISKFNEERLMFFNGLNSLDKFAEVQEAWKNKDEEIKSLEKESKEIFSKNLPIKELSYHIDDDGKEYILYKGREFAWGKISKGESLAITSKIQRALNPNGANFILIPEAQSLGSGIDEILKEAKKYKLQLIMEVTERDEPLTILFTEDNPETILSKKLGKSKTNLRSTKTNS
jgi:hypothetical protein